MSSHEGTLYIIASDASGDDWVTPEPAEEVIPAAVVEATDLAADDLADLSSYVDLSDLAAVLGGDDEAVTFTVEDHEVVVTADGGVDVTGA